jgi:hypothetical protein
MASYADNFSDIGIACRAPTWCASTAAPGAKRVRCDIERTCTATVELELSLGEQRMAHSPYASTQPSTQAHKAGACAWQRTVAPDSFQMTPWQGVRVQMHAFTQ